MNDAGVPSRRQLMAAPAAAASYQRILGANGVVQLGIIGLGGISRSHIARLLAMPDQVRITAVCDIYKPRLERGAAKTKAKGYHDYRDLLAGRNVDAVLILTPDHWHARMAIDALQAGKDVDVEKPMALTIEEARQMAGTAAKTGRLLAIDSEGCAMPVWAVLNKAIRAGVLGKLLWSQASSPRNSRELPWNSQADRNFNPGQLDWGRFLGPAPQRPLDPERFFHWRRYWDYSGGLVTDLYYHVIAPLVKATGPEFAVRATAGGGHWQVPPGQMEVPDTFLLTLDFESRHSILAGGSLQNNLGLPTIIRGHEANVQFRNGVVIEPEPPFVDDFREKVKTSGIEGTWLEEKGVDPPVFHYLPPERQEEYIARVLTDPQIRADYGSALSANSTIGSDPGERADYFSRLYTKDYQARIKPVFKLSLPPPTKSPNQVLLENFLQCLRTREKPAVDGRLGYKAQVAVSLPVLAWRRDRVMYFDPASEKVTDGPPPGWTRT